MLLIGKGTQAALDMYRCLEDVICDKERIKDIMESAADRFNLKELALYSTENEDGDDYCFIMLCTCGHIFLHIFPSYGYVGGDIFILDGSCNPEAAATYLRKEFDPDQAKVTTLIRGDADIKDMKPRRKKNIKTIRKAKNAGAKLKKLVLNQKKEAQQEL